VPKQITSWSFSRYAVYRECPLKAKLKFIDKLEEPGNEAMARGNRIHKAAEQFIKGELKTLPPELNKVASILRYLKGRYKKITSGMVVEDTWAFTKTWTKTVWNDWAACWVRIKVDVAHRREGKEKVLIITDWKTGKFREEKNDEYVEQLELYALAALQLYPDLDYVEPQLCYTDQGMFWPKDGDPIRFTHQDLPVLQKLWEKRVKSMLNDTTFTPKPNNNCRYCHYRKSNGGPCQY